MSSCSHFFQCSSFHLGGHKHLSYSHSCYIKILMLFFQQKSYIPSNRWGLDSWPSKIKVNISCAVHIILFVSALYLGWLLPNITKSCNEYQWEQFANTNSVALNMVEEMTISSSMYRKIILRHFPHLKYGLTRDLPCVGCKACIKFQLKTFS